MSLNLFKLLAFKMDQATALFTFAVKMRRTCCRRILKGITCTVSASNEVLVNLTFLNKALQLSIYRRCSNRHSAACKMLLQFSCRVMYARRQFQVRQQFFLCPCSVPRLACQCVHLPPHLKTVLNFNSRSFPLSIAKMKIIFIFIVKRFPFAPVSDSETVGNIAPDHPKARHLAVIPIGPRLTSFYAKPVLSLR